jgi:predicted AAA+ superfamily ATPase
MRELIRQKIVDSLAASLPEFTRRDIRLPSVHGKAARVIGKRRTGKTILLWQVISDRLTQGTAREGLLYFSHEEPVMVAGVK